jgi:hypothetical protein
VTIVTGTGVAFSGSAATGATATATATCSTGKLVGGGAALSSMDTSKKIAAVSDSHPSSATVWTATAVITSTPGSGGPPTLTAYAICAS